MADEVLSGSERYTPLQDGEWCAYCGKTRCSQCERRARVYGRGPFGLNLSQEGQMWCWEHVPLENRAKDKFGAVWGSLVGCPHEPPGAPNWYWDLNR
jgi:hypothetical protein